MEIASRRGPAARELGLPLPPDRMPRFRRGRPLKRWRYLGAYGPDAMVCVCEVRIGPVPQRFWAIAEPGRPIVTRTTTGAGGVRIDGSRATVEAGNVRIDLRMEEDGGVESVHPSGRAGYVWTRKQAGIPARGEIVVGGRRIALDGLGVIDDTAGYHQRVTRWRWCAGVGRADDGSRVGWNLVTGVNDPPKGSERAERTNLLLVRSSYRQPFGAFFGELPGGLRLAEGWGVMEWHDVRW